MSIAYSIQLANTRSGDYDVHLPVPKPFHTTDDGRITRHLTEEGSRIVGFAPTPEPGPLQLTWRGFTEDPDAAVGLHLVTADPGGQLACWGTPITRTTAHERTATA